MSPLSARVGRGREDGTLAPAGPRTPPTAFPPVDHRGSRVSILRAVAGSHNQRYRSARAADDPPEGAEGPPCRAGQHCGALGLEVPCTWEVPAWEPPASPTARRTRTARPRAVRDEIRGRRQPASQRGAPPGLVGQAPPLREPPATEFNRFRAIRGRDGTLVRRRPSIAVALRRGGPGVPARGRAAVLLWPCLGPEAGRAGLRTRAPARVRNPRGPSPEPRTARDTPRETRLELFPEPLPGQPEEELTSVAGHHASEPRRVDARPGQGRRPHRPRPIGHRLDGIPPIRSLPLRTPPRSAPVDRLLQHLEAPRPLRPVRNREAHPARSTGTRSPSAPPAPAAPSRAVAPPGAAAPPGVAPAWFA